MKVLFVCTHNRCRSIMAEAICNYYSGGKLEARSAGSEPAGEVHPLSLKYLQQRSIPVEGLKSQSWDEFEEWAPEVVITLCDSAAAETCPVWMDDAVQVHWGVSDPSLTQGSEQEVEQAFDDVIYTLEQRIHRVLDARLTALIPAHLKIYLESLAEI